MGIFSPHFYKRRNYDALYALRREPLRNNATNNKINTAPPTTHTQGCAYQLPSFFTFTSMSTPLSCANAITLPVACE